MLVIYFGTITEVVDDITGLNIGTTLPQGMRRDRME